MNRQPPHPHRLSLVSDRQPSAQEVREAAAQTLSQRLSRHCGLALPEAMAQDFQNRQPPAADGPEGWLTDAQLLSQWLEMYQPEAGMELLSLGDQVRADGAHHLILSLRVEAGSDGPAQACRLEGLGPDAAGACANALIMGMDWWDWDVSEVHHRTLGQGRDAEHVVLVASQWSGHVQDRWGAGLHTDPLMALALGILHSALAWPAAHRLGDLGAHRCDIPSVAADDRQTANGAHHPSARIITWPGHRHAIR